jgi:hypothetical protein
MAVSFHHHLLVVLKGLMHDVGIQVGDSTIPLTQHLVYSALCFCYCIFNNFGNVMEFVLVIYCIDVNTAIKNSGEILKKFEELDATDFFKESAGIFRNQESLN